MKTWEKLDALTARLASLRAQVAIGRVLTEAELKEVVSVARLIELVKLKILVYIAGGCALLATLAILLTLNFAQLFSVPGTVADRVTSGPLHEALLIVKMQCAPEVGTPSLFLIPTANLGFSTLASGKDMAKITSGKISITKPFADRLSSSALRAMLAHEMGHVNGVVDEIGADVFAAHCTGVDGVLSALTESERIFADPTFQQLLIANGATKKELDEYMSYVHVELGERRRVIQSLQNKK